MYLGFEYYVKHLMNMKVFPLMKYISKMSEMYFIKKKKKKVLNMHLHLKGKSPNMG